MPLQGGIRKDIREKNEFVRIKKNISRYGSKKVSVAGVEKLPNGRVVIRF
jgi:hypothetical protein